MRLIDAESLKRKAQKESTQAWKMQLKTNVDIVLNQFIDWIDEAQTVGGWISVKDRLPDIGEVLTAVKYSGKRGLYVQTGEWTGESWVSVWDEYLVSDVKKEVLYWMPLPSTEGLQDA